MTRKFSFYLLIALFLFLPFSSWIVSLTGSGFVSLIRDLLIIGLFALSLLRKKTNKSILAIALVFILYASMSVLWREASLMQWIKGYRFLLLPILFFVSLIDLELEKKEKNILLKTIIGTSVVILVLATLELIGIKIPLTSSFSGDGALSSTHVVGASSTARLQAVLAGPNALGLYLLAVCGFVLGAFQSINKNLIYLALPYLIILILTFSRSAALGFLIMALTFIFLMIKKQIGLIKSVSAVSCFVVVLLLGGFLVYQKVPNKNLFTHNDSSSLRFEQYQRIWDTKNEIGLFGRGTGTAGPSSQFRLDGGENHWTENIYLDIFEELGYIGLLTYLILLSAVFYFGLKKEESPEMQTFMLDFIAFAFAGIFINYYTGQVGIFLMWLSAGLLFLKQREIKK